MQCLVLWCKLEPFERKYDLLVLMKSTSIKFVWEFVGSKMKLLKTILPGICLLLLWRANVSTVLLNVVVKFSFIKEAHALLFLSSEIFSLFSFFTKWHSVAHSNPAFTFHESFQEYFWDGFEWHGYCCKEIY